MFTIIYEFEIKPGTDVAFYNTWQKMTQIIQENNVGSYGGALHKMGDNIYQSHAQWESQNAWENMKDMDELGYGYLTEQFRSMIVSAGVIRLGEQDK